MDRTLKKVLLCNEFFMLFNGFDLLILSKIAATKKASLRGFVLDFLIKHVMVAMTVIPRKQGKEACCYQRKS